MLKKNKQDWGMTGKHHSKKTKRKISKNLKKQYKLHKLIPTKSCWTKNHIPWNKGLTKEIDKRIRKYSKKGSETLKRLYDTKKITSYWLNKPRSKKTKEKISKSLIGKPLSKETRKKISLSNTGRICSEKTRKLISKNVKGKIKGMKFPKELYPNYGKRNKKNSEKTRKKIGIGNKNANKRPGVKEKRSNSLIIANNRPEVKKKRSDIMKKKWQNTEYAEKMIRNQRRSMGIKPNKPEKFIISLIKTNNLPFNYVGDGKVWLKGPRHLFNPDFLSKNPKHIIEVFGNYWHNKKGCKGRDKERIKTYSKYGYKTLIIWEHELKTPSQVLSKIKEFIKC